MRQKKIKIAFVHRALGQSGTSRHLLYILNGLDRNYFEPILILQRRDLLHYTAMLENEMVFFLAEGSTGTIHRIKTLIKIIKKEKPDLIHAFNRRTNWLIYVASLFYDSPPMIGTLVSSNLKFKYILTEFLFRLKHHLLITNSIATKLELQSRAHVQSSSIKVIYNGIDLERFKLIDQCSKKQLQRKMGFDTEKTIVLSIGRIHPVKNLLCTLKSIKIMTQEFGMDNLQYICVGPISEQQTYDEMNAYILENNLQKVVHYSGPVEAVNDYYHIADFMVLSSWSEGLPNVILESMACGGIVFTAESADDNHVVINNYNGFRFKTNDAAHLAAMIMQATHFSECQKREIQQNARRHVEKNFSLFMMIKNFEKTYLHALKDQNHEHYC
ncbi:glycosyltransferase family 4 protein [bacterium]|nr:glycosyltransferase family 4 protein [bacterium]